MLAAKLLLAVAYRGFKCIFATWVVCLRRAVNLNKFTVDILQERRNHRNYCQENCTAWMIHLVKVSLLMKNRSKQQGHWEPAAGFFPFFICISSEMSAIFISLTVRSQKLEWGRGMTSFYSASSCLRIGVMWSNFLDLVTMRAAKFWIACNLLILVAEVFDHTLEQ